MRAKLLQSVQLLYSDARAIMQARIFRGISHEVTRDTDVKIGNIGRLFSVKNIVKKTVYQPAVAATVPRFAGTHFDDLRFEFVERRNNIDCNTIVASLPEPPYDLSPGADNFGTAVCMFPPQTYAYLK